MAIDDKLTMSEKVTMCLTPLGNLRLEAMRQWDLANAKCSECGTDLMFHEHTICLPCSIINLGNAFAEVLEPVIDVFAAYGLDFPDEKQIARQRSKDDLSAKRRGMRRGGSEYRSR